MKASVIAYGGILIMLIITSLVTVYIIGGAEPVRRNIVTQEGSLISFVNNANIFEKSFDQSVEFISQRAAYDLGGIGGMEGTEIAVWNETYPTINALENQLENRIGKNLPKGTIENGETIVLGDASINVSNYNDAVCGPIESSKCFLVKGNKSFSFYDKSIDSRISENHPINSLINSSYFKLLTAGRKMVSAANYENIWWDATQLQTLLKADFGPDMKISLAKDGNYIKFSVWEECDLDTKTYCIAPTKPGEATILHNGNQIQYDYVNLSFKVLLPECNDKTDNDLDGKCDFNGCCPGSPTYSKLFCMENGFLWLDPDPQCTNIDDNNEGIL